MANYVTWSDEMTLEAMRLRLRGKTNQQVADIMGVSFNSVKARFNRLCHAKAGLGGCRVWDGTWDSLERYRKWSAVCESNSWRNPAWTTDEQKKVAELFCAGLTAGEIAEQMDGRSESAIKMQITRLGLTRTPPNDVGMPWFSPDRPTETRTYAGCRISVTGDCGEATREFTARLMVCVGYFGKRRAAAKFGAA